MKRGVPLVLLAMLLWPAGTAAQDGPTIVCTEFVTRDGSLLEGSPALRGQPPDGECDMIVYLPLVVADSTLLQTFLDQAQRDRDTARDRELLGPLAQSVDDGTFDCEADRQAYDAIAERNLLPPSDELRLKIADFLAAHCP
jgi:hypothetical protein